MLIENPGKAVFLTRVIRRDYILRMIQAFTEALARIRSLKKDQRWLEARELLESELRGLMALTGAELARLSETELLAIACQNEPTHSVRTKILMLTTLLNEAGDIAAAQPGETGAESALQYHLKALNLLLTTLAREDVFDFPEFVPAVEKIALSLQDAPLPDGTLSLLMHHYERTGQFGKAADTLFALLAANSGNRAAVDFGIAFYRRLLAKSDDLLGAGNLPRSEAQEALDNLLQQSRTSRP